MTPAILARPDAPRIGERALARSVTATWWYTFGGIVFFALVAITQWFVWVVFHSAALGGTDALGWRFTLITIALVLALGGVGVLLRNYRPTAIAGRDDERALIPRADVYALGAIAVAGLLLGVGAGSWMAGLSIPAFAISVRPWLPGIRWRIVTGVILALLAVGVAETNWSDLPRTELGTYAVPALFAVMLPLIAATSLWWWDIVIELDRARQAESLLAATRERLRLANDVHDLQGHHLQVIALQLELAERLMDRDPAAAAVEVARARSAVDDARQGTRDLASAFRGVPLPDELENAIDLLRSAGLEVQARVATDAASAPADVLGPIVRESVTNVLKHGRGVWARLSLERNAHSWVYRIANDAAEAEETGYGSGIAGMTARANAVGGDARVRRDPDTFEVTVTLPDRGVRGEPT